MLLCKHYQASLPGRPSTNIGPSRKKNITYFYLHYLKCVLLSSTWPNVVKCVGPLPTLVFQPNTTIACTSSRDLIVSVQETRQRVLGSLLILPAHPYYSKHLKLLVNAVVLWQKKDPVRKKAANGRHWLSRPMRIIGQIYIYIFFFLNEWRTFVFTPSPLQGGVGFIF